MRNLVHHQLSMICLQRCSEWLLRRHHQRSQYLLLSLHTSAEQKSSLVMMGRALSCLVLFSAALLCYRKRKEILGGLKSVEEQGLVQFWTIILGGHHYPAGTGPPLDPSALHVSLCFDTTGTRVWYMYVGLNVLHAYHAATNWVTITCVADQPTTKCRQTTELRDQVRLGHTHR